MRARCRLFLAIAWSLAMAPARAQFTDVSGNWQVDVDCDDIATATSFLDLGENTTTGRVTALTPPFLGTIEFPTAIQRIDSHTVVSGPTTGAVSSSGSSSVSVYPDMTRTHVTLTPPYDYVLAG